MKQATLTVMLVYESVHGNGYIHALTISTPFNVGSTLVTLHSMPTPIYY